MSVNSLKYFRSVLNAYVKENENQNFSFEIEFGMDPVALITCFGQLRLSPEFIEGLQFAIKQKRCDIIIFDFHYCALEMKVVVELFEMMMDHRVSAFTTEAIIKLSREQNCSLPSAYRQLLALRSQEVGRNDQHTEFL
jgi:hypothetical protein